MTLINSTTKAETVVNSLTWSNIGRNKAQITKVSLCVFLSVDVTRPSFGTTTTTKKTDHNLVPAAYAS